ncbi:MAG: hypothetical protein E6Q62_04910 [Nitrosomonas sp.]|nr:MAG: hypothetical protein E6Q62_04910 [Nitrosomonas sp.]
MYPLIIVLSLVLSVNVLAQAPETKNPEIIRLEQTMARVAQESQATYQQFLMTQELRRNEMLESPENIPIDLTGKSIPIPNYEDLQRRRQEKKERMEKYKTDLDHLYTRYQELESERQAIYEKIKSMEGKIPAEE